MDRMGNDWDRRGLPAWTYHNEALLGLEMQEVFLKHWQIAGHVNDVASPGDYFSFDIGPERVVILKGDDGEVRAFHNLCRHRGSRVVAYAKGHCKNALVCPFHGWVYNLDGTLRGPARPKSYPPLDKNQFGLKPVEMEIWQGLIFVLFKPGTQGSVAELLKPFLPELSPYRVADMLPSRAVWTAELPVNWKSIRDVDNEGYHVAMAHPALHDLYGTTYHDIPMPNGLNIAKATLQPQAGRSWSVRNYMACTESPDFLPEALRTTWAYYGIFPNGVIVTTPETVQFYQEFPVAVGRSVVRGSVYRHATESRRQRAARYLSYRIDRETYEEDTQLSIWSNESMKSSAFENFHLSDLERTVRAHHDHLRRIMPVMTLDKAPKTDDLALLNYEMRRVPV